MGNCRSLSTVLLLTAWLLAPGLLVAGSPGGHPKVDPDGGWIALFDGTDLDAWELMSIRGDAEPGAWAIENGTLTRKAKGYLASRQTFGDFILDLQFKVGPGTNSGVMVRFDPAYAEGKIYWFNGLIEIQLLDCHGKTETDTHDCGALYDMLAPSENAMRPAGKWNRMTVTAKGSQITIVLNGKRIVDADLDDWTEAEKNPDGTPNKYHKPMKDAPRRGHILLQDHPGEVWFRNISVKRLD